MTTPFIEVTGKSHYQQEIELYVANLLLEVRAQDEQKALADVHELREKVVQIFLSNGLFHAHIIDGGLELRAAWHDGEIQTCYYKLIVQHPDAGQLYGALIRIEPLFDNQRYFYKVTMRQPQFKFTDAALAQAQRAAFQQAQQQAKVLAHEAGCHLGEVLQIIELSPDQIGQSDDSLKETLLAAQRFLELRYRVRFGLQPKS